MTVRDINVFTYRSRRRISLIGAYSLLGAGSTLAPGILAVIKRCSLLPETQPFSILWSGKKRIEGCFLFEEYMIFPSCGVIDACA